MNAFSATFANIPPEQWTATIEYEISEDLHLMQMQPDIMIKAESDTHLNADKDRVGVLNTRSTRGWVIIARRARHFLVLSAVC
jgi:hypothetical protein